MFEAEVNKFIKDYGKDLDPYCKKMELNTNTVTIIPFTKASSPAKSVMEELLWIGG